LQSNILDIFVFGEVDEAEVRGLFTAWQLLGAAEPINFFYEQAVKAEPVLLSEQKEAQQSILMMAWQLPIKYGDSDYLALQVMNGLFGALPHSKLFSIVRERESLAYEIDSEFDSFAGLFRVSAGIDAADFEQTKALILKLLEDLIAGDFTDEEIQKTKTLLKNSYLMGLDSPASLIEQAFLTKNLPERSLSQAAWLAALEAVSKADIVAVARKLSLQTFYFLEGDN